MTRAACGKTNRLALYFAGCLVPFIAGVVALALGPGSAHGGLDPVVRVGAEMLLEEHRHLIKGQRIGVITNPSAVIGNRHLIEFLHRDPDVRITALFGPEHGIRGTADAGEVVGDSIDERTGAPVYSLYGPVRRPTMEMLEKVDVLLFDMQDVGTRFYT